MKSIVPRWNPSAIWLILISIVGAGVGYYMVGYPGAIIGGVMGAFCGESLVEY